MNELLYFAYGSNLHPLRLAQRVGDVATVAVGQVAGTARRFNKIGRDGSGKCNLVFSTSEPTHTTGVVYRMSLAQKSLLDRYESLGRGYEACEVHVQTPDGPLRAMTYVAMQAYVDENLHPFHWYRELVWLGALSFGFPKNELDQLRTGPAISDRNEDRAREHGQLADRIRGTLNERLW